MELQQLEFDVRQLELFIVGVLFATRLARRALPAVGGDDIFNFGIDNAFNIVQREATDALQSRFTHGRVRACANSDLLFRERLRQKFLRLERLYFCAAVVRRRVLFFIPLAALLGLGQIERLQLDGAIGVRDKIRERAQLQMKICCTKQRKVVYCANQRR